MIEQVEPFDSYKGMGKPWLSIARHKKWCFISWGDGTMVDYREFYAALDKEVMGKHLRAMFWGNAYRLSRASTLSSGGVHGSWSHVPHDLADAAYAFVKDCFTDALVLVDKVRGTSPGDMSLIKMSLINCKHRTRTRKRHFAHWVEPVDPWADCPLDAARVSNDV